MLLPPNLNDYLWNFTFSCETAPDCFFVFYKSWLTWILATGDAEEPAEESKVERGLQKPSDCPRKCMDISKGLYYHNIMRWIFTHPRIRSKWTCFCLKCRVLSFLSLRTANFEGYCRLRRFLNGHVQRKTNTKLIWPSFWIAPSLETFTHPLPLSHIIFTWLSIINDCKWSLNGMWP